MLIEKLYHNNQIFNVYVYFEHTSVSFSHSNLFQSKKKSCYECTDEKYDEFEAESLEHSEKEYNRINTNILTTVDISFALFKSNIELKIIRFNIIVSSELN